MRRRWGWRGWIWDEGRVLLALITCPRYLTFFLRRSRNASGQAPESNKEKGDFLAKASAAKKGLYAVDAVRYWASWRFLIAPVLNTDLTASIVASHQDSPGINRLTVQLIRHHGLGSGGGMGPG